MTRDQWKLLFEAIGISAIVASLLFLALQIRQDQQIAAVQAYVDSASVAVELAQLINEEREVWVKGLNGDELSEIDESKFQAMAWATYQRQLAIWQRRVRLDAGNPASWVESFAYDVYIYPGLRRYINDQQIGAIRKRRQAFSQEFTGSGFLDELQKAVADLDRRSPPLPDQKTYNIN